MVSWVDIQPLTSIKGLDRGSILVGPAWFLLLNNQEQYIELSDWPRAVSQSEAEKISARLRARPGLEGDAQGRAEAGEIPADPEQLERRDTARASRALAN